DKLLDYRVGHVAGRIVAANAAARARQLDELLDARERALLNCHGPALSPNQRDMRITIQLVQGCGATLAPIQARDAPRWGRWPCTAGQTIQHAASAASS